MPEERYITIVSERKTIALRVSTILYVLMNGKYANIHVLGDQVYRTTMTLGEIEEKIGDGFLRVHRGFLVAVRTFCKELCDRMEEWRSDSTLSGE